MDFTTVTNEGVAAKMAEAVVCHGPGDEDTYMAGLATLLGRLVSNFERIAVALERSVHNNRG